MFAQSTLPKHPPPHLVNPKPPPILSNDKIIPAGKRYVYLNIFSAL